jgi:hypothetical protein
MADPFSDNPFAVGSSAQQRDDTPLDNPYSSTGAWGSAPGAGAGDSAWGATTTTTNEVYTPSTLPPNTEYTSFGGGASTAAGAPQQSPSFGLGGSGSTALGLTEDQLRKREQELNKREAELKRLETELRNNGVVINSKKNWPKWCSVVHHNIAEDIPENLQWTVRSAYFCYVGLLVCLVWNFIGCCGAWITNGSISSFLWGSLYVVGGVPGAWWLWYGRLYKAATKDSALGYGLFFLTFSTAHLIFVGWSAVAPPIINSWSHTGFWVGAQEVQGKSGALAILYYIGGGFWSAEFLWSFWTLKKVYWAFRGAGHTSNNVKMEAARGAVLG